MKNRRLTFKFSFIFLIFTVVTLLVTAQISYFNQNSLFQVEQEHNSQNIASYLEEIVLLEKNDFLNMQKYFIPHAHEYKIPMDFNEKNLARDWENFERLYSQKYPGKIIDKDIPFDELSEDVKKAYSLYYYEYYRLFFEKAVKEFNIAYAYYLVPTGEPDHMCWFLEPIREPSAKDNRFLNLCVDVLDEREKYPHMWQAWDTGKRPEGYDTYDNKYGKTYSYYTPVFINGQKLGVIGVEIEIAKVNKAIFYATIRQLIAIGLVIIGFMLLLLLLIRSRYIRKLIKIQNVVDEYSQTKDSELAEKLLEEVTNNDEISGIMAKLADLFYELELYMYNLNKTKRDLKDTRQQAIELNELAIKDSLTGIRNKLGYDKEVQKIEWEMADGLREIGVAMVDLNFLKRINDTYGHDKGNIAIVTMSRIICHVFEHSPVFRIGGDEFVVILKGHDLEHIDELIHTFNEQLKVLHDNPNLEYWEKISAAIGYAVYNPETDSSYENIFKRADSEMYRAKKAMKAVRKD
ncbi:GGDEF domain-containing protein [Treponema sp.]|uniref:GGDEF domain-containing protein n=1 Tax=Treponema sp. TaxID=166 RepID=UPI00388EC630